MRVLFVAHGRSHVPWLVPLAWACGLAGHEVRMAARPQSVDRVTDAGLTAVPVGDRTAGDAFAASTLPDTSTPPANLPRDWPLGPIDAPLRTRFSWGEQVIGLADSLADDLVAFARYWRPHLVVHDIGAVAGVVAAAAVGVPAIGHAWCQPMGCYFLREDEVPASYVRMFERFGLAPRLGCDTWVDNCPPALRRAHPVPRIPARFMPYNGPGTLPEWLLREPERARVCVSGGITTSTIAERRDRMLDEFAGLDAEVVLTVPDRDAAGPVPPNVRLTGWVPLNAVLGTSSVLVHHGGAGSGMTALAHGLPQIVVPDAGRPTQGVWGELVERAGAGTHLTPVRQAAPGALRAAVVRALAGGADLDGARRVRAEIDAMPTQQSVVDLLADIAAVPTR